MMKIVVLDGYAANPGDLSWDIFNDVAELTVYDRTPQEKVAERIGNADGIFINKIDITKEVIAQCPNLKYVGVMATGYNGVDTKSCREAGITVTNIPAYSTDSVAQHTFALILNFTNHVQEHSVSVQNGDWVKCPDFCYWKSPLTELTGKTLGIFGFGSIGQKVASIAHAFGMNVLIHVHSPKSFTGNEKAVSSEELFKNSDFITLHSPLTAETANLINKDSLSLMKKTAYVINTARGGLVNEKDLRQALDEGKIAGYAADSVSQEPMSKDSPLLGAKNCILTPHVAWAPFETRERLFKITLENLKAFISGKSINVVN